jgi:hypothetical protein
MDPARMFKESLTSRPELENSQGQSRQYDGPGSYCWSNPVNGHRRHVLSGPFRTTSGLTYPRGKQHHELTILRSLIFAGSTGTSAEGQQT